MARFTVITKTEDGVRRHYVLDEEKNVVIDSPFFRYSKAEKAARLLNKEEEKQAKEANYGKVIAK